MSHSIVHQGSDSSILSTHVTQIRFSNIKTRVLLLKFALGPSSCWGRSCIVGRDNCCHGASTGRPCGISLIYIWGGTFCGQVLVVWRWVVGVTVRCVWLRGWRSEDAWIIIMHRKLMGPTHVGGTSYSTLVCLAELGTLKWLSVLLLSVMYGNIQTPNHITQNC